LGLYVFMVPSVDGDSDEEPFELLDEVD